MMTRIVFCLFFTTLCTMSYGAVNSQSGLSALLQQQRSQGPSTTTSTFSGLSTLLSSSTVSPAPAVNPLGLQAGLLQQFVTVQSNPLYAKAMSILNDASLQDVYRNALFSMQLLFLKYATQDLNKLSQQSIAASKPSLSSLLTAVASTSGASNTSSGAIGLSSLLSSATTHSQSGSTTTAQSSVTSLLQALSTQRSSTPVVKKPNMGLQNLLEAVATPLTRSSVSATAPSVASRKPVNNLSALLAAQD